MCLCYDFIYANVQCNAVLREVGMRHGSLLDRAGVIVRHLPRFGLVLRVGFVQNSVEPCEEDEHLQ